MLKIVLKLQKRFGVSKYEHKTYLINAIMKLTDEKKLIPSNNFE